MISKPYKPNITQFEIKKKKFYAAKILFEIVFQRKKLDICAIKYATEIVNTNFKFKINIMCALLHN